jgi:ABC-type multidrug transport system ATPase subunit
LLDGHDLREYDQKWLHSQVAIVTQEPVLFAMTLRENILYGVKPGSCSQTDIENAAIKANAHDFITKDLNRGYDTRIGERGVSLSGGQKQRIAIARAVLQNPKLLLLDEATSALDSQSEAVVQDALNKLMEGRTTIVIAHRLSTVQHCDQIVVIEKGVMVEIGTHHELLRMEGIYHKLATRQIVHAEQEQGQLVESMVEKKEEGVTEQPTLVIEKSESVKPVSPVTPPTETIVDIKTVEPSVEQHVEVEQEELSNEPLVEVHAVEMVEPVVEVKVESTVVKPIEHVAEPVIENPYESIPPPSEETK